MFLGDAASSKERETDIAENLEDRVMATVNDPDADDLDDLENDNLVKNKNVGWLWNRRAKKAKKSKPTKQVLEVYLHLL